ncbi:MAG: glycosyltransferase family 4 protein [Pseudomonadota bacterium]
MNNLLVLAFHYPPDNTSTGVLRTYKFTEYLLRHGWRSHVLTVPEHLYTSRNPSGSDVIPSDITVERVWACDVKQTFGIGGIYPSWLGFPDRYWPWYFAARRAGMRAIRSGAIRAIYSTYPVPTAHLVGLSLKRRSGLPWVADFRDPWATEGEAGWRARWEARLEKRVVQAADRVICNTPAMRRDFLRRYPQLAEEKFVTITNGYDEKDMAAIVLERVPRFHILYPGTLDGENRNPRSLLAGVRCALDRGWLDAEDLQVTFLGCGAYGESERFRDEVRRLALERVVATVRDRIPYKQALARIAGADVVVVLSEHIGGDAEVQSWTAMQVPAKLYEYLRIGRPILALVSEGSVKELLQATGAGVPIPPANTDAVAEALRDLYANRRGAGQEASSRVAAGIAAYSRENLTAQLAQELNVIACAASNGAGIAAAGTLAR